MNARTAAVGLVLIPLFMAACGSADSRASADGAEPLSGSGDPAAYRGPSVGAAKGFSALAERAITAVNGSLVTGNLGLSGAPATKITGFEPGSALAFGTDASAPNTLRTILTQAEVGAMVADIDARACDHTSAGLDGTFYPGVTCVDGDARLSGSITLDARGDSSAFFVIRGEGSLSVADAAQVELANGAQACSVFWRVAEQVTLGSDVGFYGNVSAGSGITMGSGSTLVGRALARTGSVVLDANAITLPLFDGTDSANGCTHVQ